MSHNYCASCDRVTYQHRRFAFGTWFMVFLTMGWWLIVMLFYRKRCEICGCTTAFSIEAQNAIAGKQSLLPILILILAALVIGANLLVKYNLL